MNIKSRVLTTGCTLAALAFMATAHAGAMIKTGLWEETDTVKRDGTPRTATIQNCLTEKDVDSNKFDQQLARIRNNKSCTLDNLKKSDRSISSEWTCAGPQVNMHGKGEFVYDDSTHFHMTSEEHTSAAGRSIDTNVSAQGRWLAADCGNVKPLSSYSAK